MYLPGFIWIWLIRKLL